MLFPVLLALLCQAKAPTHEQFIAAIRRNDRPAVESILTAKPALVNERDGPREGDWSGPTWPLECAAGMRNPAMVRLLIEKGADVHARGVNEFTALHLARDAETVRILLDDRADPHARDTFGMTPLGLAARESNLEVVRALIDAGVHHDVASALDLGLRDEALAVAKYGPLPDAKQRSVTIPQFAQDPLCIAAGCGELEIVKVLLDRGMSIEVPSDFMINGGPYSALNYAVWSGHEDVARLLLERGASTEMGGAYKFDGDLFDFAVQRSSPAMVRLLLEHGAKGRGSTWATDPPLHMAAFLGRTDVADVLMHAGYDFRAQADNATPLFLAAIGGHEDTVCLLESHGATLDVFSTAALGREAEVVGLLEGNPGWTLETDDRLGLTALFYAVRFRHAAIARALLAAGANPDFIAANVEWPSGSMSFSGMAGPSRAGPWSASPRSQLTPLWLAVQNDDLEMVRMLLAAGAMPDTRCFQGATALHAACGDPEIVRALLDASADPDAAEDCGFTPLMWGNWAPQTPSRRLERARLLLEHGADPNHIARDGITPLTLWCVGEETEPLAFLLVQHGARVDFLSACSLGMEDEVARRLKEDPALALTKEPRWTQRSACAIAAQRGRLGVLRRLVEAGADPRGRGDEAPIVLAAMHGQTEMVRQLIAMGVTPDARTETWRQTLLHFAAQSRAPELIHLFVEQGVDIRAVDSNGSTALHVAVGYGTLDVVRAILAEGAKANVEFGVKNAIFSVLNKPADEAIQMAKLLIEAGADVNARDGGNCTVIDWIQTGRGTLFPVDPRVEAYLRSVGARSSKET